jgi:Ku70/Ku80 beta-barrel domain
LGKAVPWDQIVKGYEYEKGKFVALKEEDFKRADIEATETVDIINFVELEEVVSVLEKSIQETGSKTKTKATSKSRGRTKTTRRSRKKAA